MKLLLSTLCTLLYISIFAQGQLVNKIPQDANAVIHAKGNKFLENISLQELSKTNLGDSILNKIFGKKRNGKDFNDLGINFSSDFFYFNQTTDSINYNALLFSISDANKFEELLKTKQGKNIKIKQQGTIKEFYKNNNLILWDNEKAVFVFGDFKNNFFDDSTNVARYGVNNSDEYVYNSIDTLAATDVMESASVEESDEVTDYLVATIANPAENDEETTVAETSTEDDDSEYENRQNSYEREREKQDSLKASVNERWLKEYAYRIYYRNTAPSILDNPNYRKVEDKEAAITFFTDKYDKRRYYYGWYPENNGLLSIYTKKFLEFTGSPLALGAKSVNVKLYLNNQNVLLKTAVEVNEKDLEQYKQMYNYKLNKKFYQYIDEDKVPGFISLSLNTEKYMELYPKWMANLIFSKDDKEEAELFTEFFNIILDEKAIAKVAKGDALFLLNGLSARESTYKTYEYEEDTYDSKEVEKTKKETLPEFLFMASSEDTRFQKSLLKYGIKKGIVSLDDGIYTIENKDYKTYKFYLLIKDGIIFIGTSPNDILNIKNGTYVAKINKKQKELLSKNGSVVYFDSSKILNQLSEEGFNVAKDYKKVSDFLKEMGIFTAKYTGISDNSINAELTLETKGENNNSVKSFLKMVEILLDF
ncbi:hypothetical protein ETU08_06880 [Apibacter muscae]|uniref:hypothetical protein n=1 Tax=Apibacter muscae TaxID=2509004 RepID=UPI0011AC04C4|nr:hypothetical protein [Apibacter muscae]TWP29566.1 hypothetical protein ETU08_06880 [Apibacter muscae]